MTLLYCREKSTKWGVFLESCPKNEATFAVQLSAVPIAATPAEDTAAPAEDAAASAVLDALNGDSITRSE